MRRRQLVNALLALSGEEPLPPEPDYRGWKVYGRAGTGYENVAGTVVGTRDCTLEGCGGTRVIVRWPDGKRTIPCLKGCQEGPEPNSFRIR